MPFSHPPFVNALDLLVQLYLTLPHAAPPPPTLPLTPPPPSICPLAQQERQWWGALVGLHIAGPTVVSVTSKSLLRVKKLYMVRGVILL